MATIPQTIANFETSLAAPISDSATSMTLASIVADGGMTIPNGVYGVTVDQGTNSQEHMIITISGASPTVSIGVRGVSVVDGASSVPSLKFRHDRGASIKMTDHPVLIRILRAINGTDTLDNPLEYTTNPSGMGGAGTENWIPNVKFVQDTSYNGTVDATTSAKGIIQLPTDSQVEDGDDVGSTGASMAPTPSQVAMVIQNQSYVFAETDAGDDAYSVTLNPAPASLSHGMRLTAQIATACTGASTLNVNDLGVVPIKKYVDGAMADTETNDLVAGMVADFIYNDDVPCFQLMSTKATDLNSAIAYETSQFFGNTSFSANNANALIGGGSATLLANHVHRGPSLALFAKDLSAANDRATFTCGFSDATTPISSVMGNSNVNFSIAFATDVGITPYQRGVSDRTAVTAVISGCVSIGTDFWQSRSGDTVEKNGSSVTISGGATPHFGAMGHDPTNSYLLILTSTTAIKRYSGIAGTTITFVSTITLDTAVTAGCGFIFDNTNNRYICIDKTNNVIRRFGSSGTTINTVAYTADDTYVCGLAMINDRVHLVSLTGTAAFVSDSAGDCAASSNVVYIPTNMTR